MVGSRDIGHFEFAFQCQLDYSPDFDNQGIYYLLLYRVPGKGNGEVLLYVAIVLYILLYCYVLKK
jgi:hypothetical protein